MLFTKEIGYFDNNNPHNLLFQMKSEQPKPDTKKAADHSAADACCFI